MQEGLLSIDSEGLTAAASSYTSAASSYQTAAEAIAGKLKAALDVWDDASKETWEGKVNLALSRISKVGSRMNSNAAVLNDIAAAATDTENNVKTGIGTL